MAFPADYTSIETCEEIIQVYIFMYEIDEEGKIRLSKIGKIQYLSLELIYLLRLENEENLITYLD